VVLTIYQYSDIIYTLRSHYGNMFRPYTVIFRPTENIIRHHTVTTQWDPISFTARVKTMYDEILIYN